MISLLIPVYNEAGAVRDTVKRADDALKTFGQRYEIIVIDDASSDDSADLVREMKLEHVSVITHVHNRGYSASLKTGIRRSTGDIIGITDADGTYPIEQVPTLLNALIDRQADMVVGARTKKGAKIPLIRRPAKFVVNSLANSLTGMKIPDLNSGLRVFRRDLAERFMHLYPQRFSFTITITLAALTNDYMVEYIPIDYFKRKGKSTMSGWNGLKTFFNFLSLIIRITTYFRPLKFFAWPSMILMISGLLTAIYTLIQESNISDTGVLLLMTGLQIGLFGLLAEVVVRHRAK